MPYIIEALLRVTGQSEALELNKVTQNVKKGEKTEPPVSVAGKTIGALACSGAIAPELYRSMVVQGAEVLTNSASLGTFTNAPLYHAQTRQMARFNAIANARPYVQASTGAYSYAIDSNGKFVFRTTKTGLNHQFLSIQTNKAYTWYSKLGEWVVLASLILTITLLVRAYSRK
jgi:apolipoprotein N-acyltransferase